MYHYKTLGPNNKKIPNNKAHLITGDINIKHPMIGANDLLTNRTGRIVE